MKKHFKLFFIFLLMLFVSISPVQALTTWNYKDWQAGDDYGSKTRVSTNITNLKGEKVEQDGMKVGPFNKASKAKISDGITEEVYVGLNPDNYTNGELFELSIALNQQDNNEAKYLTEAVVMTQKSGDKFVITANNWNKNKNPIATIDANGVYTYKWEFKKENDKIKVKFTVLDYGKVLGTTDFVELNVENSDKASDVRYLWACNIKANYGVDIYTTLPINDIENPNTADINLFLVLGLITISGLGIGYTIKKRLI